MLSNSYCHWLAFSCSPSLMTMMCYLSPIVSVHSIPDDLTQFPSCGRSSSHNDPRCKSKNISCSRVLGSCLVSYHTCPLECLRGLTMGPSPKHTRELCLALSAPSASLPYSPEHSLWLSTHTGFSTHHGLQFSLSQNAHLKPRETSISAVSKPSV